MKNIIDIFDNITNLYPDPSVRLNTLITMMSGAGYDPSNRVLVSMPDDQAASTLRIVILSYIAQAISNLEFSSSSQAQDILKEIKPIFEAQFNDQNMDVTAYNRMRRLYTKAVADIGQRGSILPRVVTFAIDPEDSIPLPVLAQYIYQDGSMADDILLRNNQTIIHPLFVNTSLEVINNG